MKINHYFNSYLTGLAIPPPLLKKSNIFNML